VLYISLARSEPEYASIAWNKNTDILKSKFIGQLRIKIHRKVRRELSKLLAVIFVHTYMEARRGNTGNRQR
jgi:hypothetical protein